MKLTDNMTKNPFDNSVVIIDEAHNFVSRVVNKIKKPDSFRAETVSSSIELGTPNDIASEPQREELV